MKKIEKKICYGYGDFTKKQDKFKDFKVYSSYFGNEINRRNTVFCQYLNHDNNENSHNIKGKIWTFNLSIGSIEDLFHHYIFNLNNKEHNPEGNSVLVTINSDDPSVFNTISKIPGSFHVNLHQLYYSYHSLICILLSAPFQK